MDCNTFMSAIAGRAAIANAATSGDYQDETGLTVCGRCHTPKQCIIPNGPGKGIIVSCMCACKEAQVRAERDRFTHTSLVMELKDRAFHERQLCNYTFANDDMSHPDITQALRRYCDNFPILQAKGKGVLLYGNIGTGKTYAACEVANELIDREYSCYVTTCTRLINDIQSEQHVQALIDRICRVQLLVIDDLASERQTEYAKEQMYNVIDTRYRSGLPMIVTTNLSIDQIKSPSVESDRRIFNRLLERCYPIEIAGKCRRKEICANDYDTMRKLLGV